MKAPVFQPRAMKLTQNWKIQTCLYCDYHLHIVWTLHFALHPNICGLKQHQFGFKLQQGTDICIFLLKQAVLYYLSKGSPVFSAYLDASKAFDITNQNLQFAKLIKHNLLMGIVSMLMSWYRKQIMQVKWATNFSSLFTTTSGAGQGEFCTTLLHCAQQTNSEAPLRSARLQ